MTTELAANPGWLRPPLVYGGAGLCAVALDSIWRWRVDFGSISVVVAVALLIVGFGIVATTLRSFRKAETPFPGNQAVVHMVETGPFGLSRNPAYLGFSVILAGVGFMFQSLWFAVALVVAWSSMNWIVIPREERYMDERFADIYRDYARRVRRWL